MAHTDRKTSFKLPPTSETKYGQTPQQLRRTRALEEQKRKRQLKLDASRNLDFMAGLTLEDSGGEDEHHEVKDKSLAHYANLIKVDSSKPSSGGIAGSGSVSASLEGVPHEVKRPKRKKNRKPSKWADKCMYAELLEMDPMSAETGLPDGIPDDLQTAWIAVSPIPAGKRCLAITQQSAGVSGAVPNTYLRSRQLGKSLLPPFPSSFPPSTVLDCILDENWRENGILHVLDVIQWKSQGIGDCETSFRFWWRDMRLAELPSFSLSTMSLGERKGKTRSAAPQFPYPINLVPIPFHSSSTYVHYLRKIIPDARKMRNITVLGLKPQEADGDANGDAMDIDSSSSNARTQINATIRPDGLLLYVAQAAYEHSTTPLATWVPIAIPSAAREGVAAGNNGNGDIGPLALFERLLQLRYDSESHTT